MKKLTTLSILLASLFYTQAFAQAKNFEGFDINLQTGYQTFKPSTTISPAQTFTVQQDQASDTPLNLNFGYTYALNDVYTIGVTFGTDLINTKKSNSNVLNNGVLVPADGSSSGEKNQYLLTIKPGYAIDDTTLAYGKIGYSWASQYGTNNDASAFNGDNIKFITVGLGAERFLNKNLYVSADINYLQLVKLNDAGTTGSTPITISTTANGYSLLLGVGYKF